MQNKLFKWILLMGLAMAITANYFTSTSVAETNGFFTSPLPPGSTLRSSREDDSDISESSPLPGEEYATSLYTSDTIAQLYRANQEQITLAKVAIEKGESSMIRALALRVLRDLTLANRRLHILADDQALSLPVAAPVPQKPMILAGLQKLSGKEFDLAYAESLLASAEESSNLWASGLNGIPIDKNLNTFLRKFSPLVEQHRQVALRLRNYLR